MSGVARGVEAVPPELARYVAHPRSEESPAKRAARLATDILERSHVASEDGVRAARQGRRDDALKAEGKSAGLLEAARLLAELSVEL